MEKKIFDFLESTVSKAYKERCLSKTYYLNLGDGYSIVLTWEEGFDTKDEHELCISLRETNSSYFVDDWNVIDENSVDENNLDIAKNVNYILEILKEQKLKEEE